MKRNPSVGNLDAPARFAYLWNKYHRVDQRHDIPMRIVETSTDAPDTVRDVPKDLMAVINHGGPLGRGMT